MKDRVLALAGLLQSLQQVRRIAATGEADAAAVAAVVESLFRFDADSVEDVYGGAASVWPGLRALIGHLDGGNGHDPHLTRVAATVLRLERRFSARPALVEQVGQGLSAIAEDRAGLPRQHPELLARIGELYAETVSRIEPRVVVQGSPAYLGQTRVVAEIRALLMAALRSAVLWRQLGGSYWDLLLRRRAMLAAARERLGGR